jgi:hypothetical protein
MGEVDSAVGRRAGLMTRVQAGLCRMSRLAMYTAVQHAKAVVVVPEFGFAGDMYDKDSDSEVCICIWAVG